MSPMLRSFLMWFATTTAIAVVVAVTVMYPFLILAVGALISFALAATYQVWLWAFLRLLARRKIIVVNVQEGTGVMVMQNGKAVRFLTADPGTDPDENWNLRQEDSRDGSVSNLKTDPHRTKQRKLRGLAAWIDRNLLPGGMRWKGFAFMGYELYEYNFRWEVLRNSEPRDDEDGLVGKREIPGGKWVASFAQHLDYIYTKDAVYYFEVLGAETKGTIKADNNKKAEKRSVGMPVTIRGVETVRIVNPYLALIFIHDWAQSTFDLVLPSLRSWVANNYFEDIVGRVEAAQAEYDAFLQSTGLPPDQKVDTSAEQPVTPAHKVEISYGVRIKRVGFIDIAPPAEYTDASVRRAEAEQEAVRIQTLADAEAARIETVAVAEANRITTVNTAIKAGGETALKLRELEALEELGRQGNVFVVNTLGGTPLINVGKTDKKGERT